jgi:photosystem II stability/assembly factor-like uncharacterized protein
VAKEWLRLRFAVSPAAGGRQPDIMRKPMKLHLRRTLWIATSITAALLGRTPAREIVSAPHAPSSGVSTSDSTWDPALFRGLSYRTVGPFRGGRVTAVAGHRRQPSTFYMGSTGGGVWKTTDSGRSWINISDGFFETGSIGAIEVSESNPDVIYVGTGSAALRSNVIVGRGVYKSTDAGRTWSFAGLRETGQIGSVRIHPRDSNTVYVAAVGQPFGPNPERGVFRTRDGGKSWQKVLFINDRTGAVSLAMNPSNPNEIYAGAWRAERKPWTIISGGPATQTGLYKTTDGGDHWTKLSRGLPSSLIGKIDVDVARSNPRRVFVILEAPGQQAGVYRSDDGGSTFLQVSSNPELIKRPFYFTYIDVDPKDENTVWVNNLHLHKSTDAGRTWQTVLTPHVDNHGMWINPDNPLIFIQSNDGGANVTLDGGRSWSTQYNQPTAEMYQVEVDDQFPYRLYGAQQDNSTVIIPSLPLSAEPADDPVELMMRGPGCETGPVKPKPGLPEIVYGVCKGEFSRLSLLSGQEKHYWVYPQNRYGQAPADIHFRFQRISPLEISPYDPGTIYMGSHVVHRTRDEGLTWETISPDLTANEPGKQGISGEPITRDITGEEVYSALSAIRESPLEEGIIWTGANDGFVYITRDAGETWKNVTPSNLPAGGRVQNIEPSSHRMGSAYIAVCRYMLNDWQPYIYKTDNYGGTWSRLTDGRNGIPADFPARVVREDPDREGLLYAGTEFGMFISFDNGRNWQSFQLNLPVTPVTDIRVYEADLVLSTMGRSFWILDDLTPLHQLNREIASSRAQLFRPRAVYRTRYSTSIGGGAGPVYPPPEARIHYLLAPDIEAPITLDIIDALGTVVRSFSTERTDDAVRGSPVVDPAKMARAGTPILLMQRGMNRFTWDMRYPGPWNQNPLQSGTRGPMAAPGTYKVRLSAGKWSQTQILELRMDPRVTDDRVSPTDLEDQLRFNLQVRDAITAARVAAFRLTEVHDRLSRSNKDPERLKQVEALLSRLVTADGPYPQPMLIDQLLYLYLMTTQADQKIGHDASVRFADLSKELSAILGKVQEAIRQ